MKSTSLILASFLVLQGGRPGGLPQAELPALALDHLGTIKLDVDAPPRPNRHVSGFDSDGRGRIGFYRWEDAWDTMLVLVAPSGDVCPRILLQLSSSKPTLASVR